jgi:hypothetical protein
MACLVCVFLRVADQLQEVSVERGQGSSTWKKSFSEELGISYSLSDWRRGMQRSLNFCGARENHRIHQHLDSSCPAWVS